MKRVWRNLSKGKKIAGLVAICLAVVLGYFGYHRLIAHADSLPLRGVWAADAPSPDWDLSATDGTEKNPFVILEIVPYVGQAEVGYLIEGCEPIKLETGADKMYVNRSGMSIGDIVDTVFEDEYLRAANGTFNEDWKGFNSEYTAVGYYEKVAAGAGDHYYDGTNWADTSGVLASGTVYRPNFKKAVTDEEKAKADFKWVTLGKKGSVTKKNEMLLENKVATSETEVITFVEGDREYTERTDNKIYTIYYAPENYYKSEDSSHFVRQDSFLRTSLNLKKASERENFYVQVKTIEPAQLNENPQWIDFADLIYIHGQGSSNSQIASNWTGDRFEKKIIDTGSGTCNDGFSAKQDLSWGVARMLFMKVNQLEKYDGRYEGQGFKFAPLIVSYNSFQSAGSAQQSNVTNNRLIYKTLEADTRKSLSDSGSVSNLYKFYIMNNLMKQENFYNYFFCKEKASGGKVIPEEPNLVSGELLNKSMFKEEGLCSSQVTETAQKCWNINTFLISDETLNEEGVANWVGGSISEDLIELYELVSNNAGVFMLHEDNQGLNGGTFTYNSNSMFSMFYDCSSDDGSIKNTDDTEDAFNWYSKEEGKDYSKLSPAQMVYYLLNYKKSGSGDNDDATRKKETLKVLEVEPCNDFILTDTYLSAYLPASRFDGNIEIDYMTTQAFNGSKKDLSGEYDLIYLGLQDGKLNKNAAGSKVEYNDSELDRKVVLHVGDYDQAESYRFSGNDISDLKVKQLKEYVDGGNGLILADKLHIADGSSFKVSSALVDESSNLYKFANSGKKDKVNVTALSTLSYEFLLNYCVSFVDSKISISGKPAVYVAPEGTEGTALSDSKLNFAFTIGEPRKKNDGETNSKYGIKIYMDINYDGVIGDSAEDMELVYDSYTDVDSESSADASAPKQYYEYVDVPKDKPLSKMTDEEKAAYAALQAEKNTHAVSFDFNTVYQNRKQPNRRNGAIAWRFVVYEVNNPGRYVAENGTSWYNSADTGKMEINVYQIINAADKGTATDLSSDPALFKKYVDILENYEINVETETLDEYLARFTEVYPYTSDIEYSEATLSQFDEYNVFLVSCGTSLQEASNARGAVSFISYQAKGGASVLYTGEALSKDSKASKAITQAIKNTLNQSRFTDSSASYVDEPTYPDGIYSLDDYNSLEYTYAAVMKKGSGDKKVFYDEWEAADYGEAVKSTDKITQLNGGSITTYPYTITADAPINVSGNIGQDFQLNMDNSRLTVWHCLSGTDNTMKDNSMYGITPNDATNNYYLYSVENVTYTGVKLGEVTDAEEMKLFINTLIGNYEIGYKPPSVTVDQIKGIKSEAKDCLELTYNSDSTESLLLFDAKMPKVKKQYLEYVPSPKPIATTTPEAEPSLDPEETAAPEATADSPVTAATPVPTETPKPTPIRVLVNETQDKLCVDIGNAHASAFNDLSDENVIVIEYHCKSSVNASENVFELRAQDWNTIKYTLTACQGTETDSTKKQVFKVSVADLKAKGFDLSYMGINRVNSVAVVDGVYVYATMADAEAATAVEPESDTSGSGGSGGGGSAGMEDEDTSLTADYDKQLASESTFIADALAANENLSHRIYFTPYDNNITGGNLRSLRISLVNRTEGEADKTHSLIKTIYQDYRDSATGKRFIFRFKAGEDGKFSIANNNFVKDSTQYYFLYDERFINGVHAGVKYNYVKFETENRKKEGTTYLNLFPDAQADNMYVFNLD